jgi:hypothetical protein
MPEKQGRTMIHSRIDFPRIPCRLRNGVLLLHIIILLLSFAVSSRAESPRFTSSACASADEREFGPIRLPVQFVRNEGQWPSYARYMLLPATEQVAFLDDGVMFILPRREAQVRRLHREFPLPQSEEGAGGDVDVVVLRFEGASPLLRLEAGEASVTKVNFYVGDSSLWREDVACTRSIFYRNVWEGIDVAFMADGDRLSQRIAVSAGSAMSPRFRFEGDAEAIERVKAALNWKERSDGSGDGDVQPSGGSLHFRVPDRIPKADNHYWTEYASFFITSRGDSVQIRNLHVDNYSRTTFTGTTKYSNLPTTANAWQRESNIDHTINHGRGWVWYFGRLRCDGLTPDYLSYYGAYQPGFINYSSLINTEPISNNSVYLHTGHTGDTTLRNQYLPVKGNALEYRYSLAASVYRHPEPYYSLLSRFDTTGRLVYSSMILVGSNSGPIGPITGRISIGQDLHCYIHGAVYEPSPFVRPGVFMDTMTAAGGVRAFLLKLTPELDSVVYCTYLPKGTHVIAVAADAAGYATILAMSEGDFPVKEAFQPDFRGGPSVGNYLVARISPLGDSLVFATYLGGSGGERYFNSFIDKPLLVTPDGRSFIAGITPSDDVPLHRPFQSELRGGKVDGYIMPHYPDLLLAGFEPDGRILFSTYWGGSGSDYPGTLTMTPCGDLLVTGRTTSRDFPQVAPPGFCDTAATWADNAQYATFMLLLDPDAMRMRTSFLHPEQAGFRDVAIDSAGYMYSAAYVWHTQQMFNGFAPPINAQEQVRGSGTYSAMFRSYFPLCGEDLLDARPLIPDTVAVDSMRQYISHYEFTLSVELRNRDDRRAALHTRSTIELPEGIVLVEGQAPTKTPEPDMIPPGGFALVSWKLRLDTAALGGWAGLWDRMLDVRITHEYQLSNAFESCLTSFSWSRIPLYVKRKDSEIAAQCAVWAQDTLRLSDDALGHEPSLLTISGLISNIGTMPIGPGTAALRLGGVGGAVHPPGDSLRSWPSLGPGDTYPLEWSVRPGKRIDVRHLHAELVVLDEKGSVTACTHDVRVPAIPPLRCALQGPDTVRILKSGELVPPDIFTRILLRNVLDTLVGGAEVELYLSDQTHLRMHPADTLRKPLGFIPPGSVRDARWQLELTQAPAQTVSVPVTVRYRCDGLPDWSECVKDIVLLPMSSDLLCTISAPSSLDAEEVVARQPVDLLATVGNIGVIAESIDRIDLAIGPDAGVTALDPLSQPGGTLAANSDMGRQWRLRALVLRDSRNARFDVTAYGDGDSVLTVCTHDMHIPGIDGLLCDITAPDSVRFVRDELRYHPDPVDVRVTLRNILDERETGIEAELQLAAAPRLRLAPGRSYQQTLPRIDAGGSADFTWPLIPQAGDTDEIQEVIIRYRSVEQGDWKECMATIVIEGWPRIPALRCTVSGHDSLHVDPAYERLIPEPFEVSYTATNTGTVTLHNCEASIVLPPEFELDRGDITLSFGDIAPGNTVTRWWTLRTTSALSGFGAYPIRWTWRSDEQGGGEGCEHTVHIVPEASSGIVFTPLHLHFEAERNDPLPAAQYVDLWTGGGLSMPWTAQGGDWWLAADPASGDRAARLAVQPVSTALPIGWHATALTIAGQAPNLPRDIAVTYEIHAILSVQTPGERLLKLGEIWPQPVPLNGEARISVNVPAGEYVRIMLYDALGRELALLRDGVMPEAYAVLRITPSALRLQPGMYFIRMIVAGSQAVRGVVVR